MKILISISKKRGQLKSEVAVKKIGTLAGHHDCVYTGVTGKANYDLFFAAGDGMMGQWNLNNSETGEGIAKSPDSIYTIYYPDRQDPLIGGQNHKTIHLPDYNCKKGLKSLRLTKKAIFDIGIFENKPLTATGEGIVQVIDLNIRYAICKIEYTSNSDACIAIHTKTEELIVRYSDHHIRIFSLVYSPDGISRSRDVHLKVWHDSASCQLDEISWPTGIPSTILLLAQMVNIL